MNQKKQANIHPIFGQILTAEDKEELLQQKGAVLWLTGLSGSGKSTVAKHLERKLHGNGYLVKVLDGDNLRSGMNGDLGFSVEDRRENIRRVAEIANLFNDTGIITLSSFISPTLEIRQMAKEIIGEDNFHEVYISASLEVCEGRDVKGLYQKARAGEIKDFTGINSPFEAPENPAAVIDTGKDSIEACVDQLYTMIMDIQSKAGYSPKP